MGNFAAPELSYGSKIYRMARDRNFKVLITSLAVFILGMLSLYDGLVRPGAQTPAGLVIIFLIIAISFYGIYLFLTRSQDMFRQPDVKKFLSFDDPRHYLDLFEQEYKDGSLQTFRDGFATRNFIVAQSFYRFRWAHSREITMAYIEPEGLSFRRIRLPFLGISTVMVHLSNGATLHVNCNSKEDAETLLKMIVRMAPSARYSAPVRKKSKTPSDIDAIAQDVAATIRDMPDLQRPVSPASPTKRAAGASVPARKTPVAGQKGMGAAKGQPNRSPGSAAIPATKPEPARARPLSKEEMLDGQIKDLYDSLEKEDIARSTAIIDSMGDARNVAATEILGILLDYEDEPVRVHASLALVNLAQKSSVEQLIKALDDSSAQVRENAAIALGKIGDQRAVAPLQQVSTADVRTKKAAVSALSRIDQKLGIFNQPGSEWSQPFFSSSSDE